MPSNMPSQAGERQECRSQQDGSMKPNSFHLLYGLWLVYSAASVVSGVKVKVMANGMAPGWIPIVMFSFLSLTVPVRLLPFRFVLPASVSKLSSDKVQVLIFRFAYGHSGYVKTSH